MHAVVLFRGLHKHHSHESYADDVWMSAGGKPAAIVQDTAGELRVDECRPE